MVGPAYAVDVRPQLFKLKGLANVEGLKEE